jgi:hypothetical protein
MVAVRDWRGAEGYSSRVSETGARSAGLCFPLSLTNAARSTAACPVLSCPVLSASKFLPSACQLRKRRSLARSRARQARSAGNGPAGRSRARVRQAAGAAGDAGTRRASTLARPSAFLRFRRMRREGATFPHVLVSFRGGRWLPPALFRATVPVYRYNADGGCTPKLTPCPCFGVLELSMAKDPEGTVCPSPSPTATGRFDNLTLDRTGPHKALAFQQWQGSL